MRRTLIDDGWLVDQASGGALELTAFREADGHVLEGVLTTSDGTWYPIQKGVPSLLRGALRKPLESFRREHNLPELSFEPIAPAQNDQRETASTFSDKWQRFRTYGLEASHEAFLQPWCCRKLGLPDVDSLKRFYRGKRCILEVGPGSGFNARFMAENTDGIVFAADVSEAAEVCFENTAHLRNCHVLQADLMDLPLPDGAFDFIVADGVLHHTPDTKAALSALYAKLASGGDLFFYVYREMGAARQFCDAHLRTVFSGMEPEDCYEACRGLTELGRELSRLNVEVTLERGVPALGIPAGTHDVQRLLYYNFIKCFWNDAFDFETNNMVNFDWYHPHNAWQHTEEEVCGWLAELGVTDYSFHEANPNGLSVLFRKP